MKISKKSLLSGRWHTMEVPITAEQHSEILKGVKAIQNICPEVDSSLREFMINGITPLEWEATFKEED